MFAIRGISILEGSSGQVYQLRMTVVDESGTRSTGRGPVPGDWPFCRGKKNARNSEARSNVSSRGLCHSDPGPLAKRVVLAEESAGSETLGQCSFITGGFGAMVFDDLSAKAGLEVIKNR